MIDEAPEDDSDASPAPTPMPTAIALLILAGQLQPPEVPEHDSPLEPRACGCGGWCELRKP